MLASDGGGAVAAAALVFDGDSKECGGDSTLMLARALPNGRDSEDVGPADQGPGGRVLAAPPPGRHNGLQLETVSQSNAFSTFQTFHTFPAKSGPGVNVGLPGCQPDGVTSPVAATCWNAFN